MAKHLLKVFFFLVILLGGKSIYAQSHIITGTVVSKEDSLPLSGVSVFVEGSSSGVQTTAGGKFSLSIPSGSITLVFSFIGYETAKISIGDKNVINVALLPSVQSLNEVVVTGSGVATHKARLGIAVETVQGKNITQSPQGTIDQGLIGMIPGAQISAVDGTPGATTNIILRGINTVQGTTSPMILVDGVQAVGTDISTLDPAAVDHIEIVQGAAASTIYGAQGANGVIQIFTKKGTAGPPKIDLSSNLSISSYLNVGHVQEAKLSSFKTDANGNFIDSNGNPVTLDQYGIYEGVNWAYGPDQNSPTAMANPLNIYHQQYGTNLKFYDHLAQLFQSSVNSNNSIAVSGADGPIDYSVDISNNNQQSNIRNNGYNDRTNLTTNLGITLFKGFTLRSITQLAYTRNTLNPYFLSGSNSIFGSLDAAPYINLNQKLANGTYPYDIPGVAGSNPAANPNYITEYSSQVINRVDILENLQADYRVDKFVDLNAKYGIDYYNQKENPIFQNQSQNSNSNITDDWIYYFNYNDNTGEIDERTTTSVFQNINISAIIKTDFIKDFNLAIPISTTTLLELDHRKDYADVLSDFGYSLPLTGIYNIGQTATQTITETETPFITYGYVVNQKIDYGEYGGIGGGFRSDYSSAFGEGSKPFTFPDVNGYLRPSSFNFWRNGALNNLIPEIKLRAAFGEAGIQPMPFDRYPTLVPSHVGSAQVFTLNPAENNADLTVEVSKEFEAGTDIQIKGFTGDWLPEFNVSATYWTRKGNNVIYPISVAPSTGGTTIKTNSIDLAAHGVQASVTALIYKVKDFNWNFTINFSNESTVITKITGPPIILTSAAGNTQEALIAGQKIGQLYGYKALTSVDEKNQEGVPYIPAADYNQYTIVDGRVVNIATKGVQFTNEVYALGDPNPKFNASFINGFNYKQLIVGFQFDWVYGSHLYNQTKEWMYRDGISSDYDKPVDIAGTTAAYTAYYRSIYADIFGDRNGTGRNATKDYFYEGSSFLRLRNISLGYDFSKALNSKIFRRAVLTLSGRNILTFTKYTGFDPELSSGASNSPYDRGVDDNSMPGIKSYAIGLNLGF